MTSRWYQEAIIYELRTRSYFDSNDDGIGDLRGVTARLDYLADLGVTAIWLLPHYPSPGRDDGYDIADYTNVHPEAGTLDDFDELVVEAHRRKIRVITELVVNHSSDQHPWFQRARRAPPGSPERDFYLWSDTPDRFKEARIIFNDTETSNWTWDPVARAYYWHRFFAHQPDLNFDNPIVRDAVIDVVDFWLARGVDGLRLDAIQYLYKREGTTCENLPETHAFLKALRAHVDARFEDRLLLAEANQWPDEAARYFGDGDECHMNFHFPIMPRLFMAIHMEDRFPIIDILRQTPKPPPECQWAMFLRNHDELTLEMVTDEERDYMYRAYAREPVMRLNLGIRRRLAPLCGNDRRTMELLDALLFSMPGTPVLYYGDEIGMGDNVYLGDRYGVRTPMQWSPDRNGGFSRANPQRLDLPVIIDPTYHYEALNVETQQSDSNSLLWWTKRVIAMRKKYHAFGRGNVEMVNATNPAVFSFLRRYESETLLVVANLSRRAQYVELELSGLKGMTPVELVGRARFPPIGDGPYSLSLGGHDFFWFSIEAPPPEHELRARYIAPTLTISNPAEMFTGPDRAQLERILPAFLEAHGWLGDAATGLAIVDSVQIDDEPATHLVFTRVEYTVGLAETIVVPLLVLSFDAELAKFVDEAAPPPGALIATLRLAADGAVPKFLLVFASSEGIGRLLLDAIAFGTSYRTRDGVVVGQIAPGATVKPDIAREARLLATDPRNVAVAYGTSHVMRLFYRTDDGIAPQLEVARLLAAQDRPVHVPRLLGWVEHRRLRGEPITLAMLEEQVANEGTAWAQAFGELGRAFERVLAHPSREPVPEPERVPLPRGWLAPVEAPRELVGTYRDLAALLGARIAELHIALASSHDPAFEPVTSSAMDRRSDYQTARNLVGRVIAALRRTRAQLPPAARLAAERVLAAEPQLLARFDPLKTLVIDAKRIRIHGDLRLDTVLFTGKDFVMLPAGRKREGHLADRRRKTSALRDVASMIRSYHEVAAAALLALRPEDQLRAEPWRRIWARSTSATFLHGYLEAAGAAVFLSRDPATIELVLDTALLERTLRDLLLAVPGGGPAVMVALDSILELIG